MRNNIILVLILITKCFGHVCQPPDYPFLQSPSCNEKSKEILPTNKCCPRCCQNSTGFCDDCNVDKCLDDNSPSIPWSNAYTSISKKSFMLVLQRPQIWDVPQVCSCGDHLSAKLFHLSGEPLFENGPFGSPFEENLSHLRQKLRDKHGCCTPPIGHDWYTRSLFCEFDQPCDVETLKLIYSDQGDTKKEIIPVSVLNVVGGEEQNANNALICIPRYDRDLTKHHQSSHHLTSWLEHHALRNFGQVLIYSDDCLAQVLTPAVLKAQTPIILSNPNFQVSIIDISTSRDIPAWYHNQILAIRDCWARGVASEASWIASIDIDEFLVIPQGWTSSSFFGGSYTYSSSTNALWRYKPSVSFGSINACSKIVPSTGWCVGTWKGHRKYIIRATPSIDRSAKGEEAERIRISLLKPPGYIHGDPNEYKLSTQSGMFILHFSRCSILDREKSDFPLWLNTEVIQRNGLSMASLIDLEPQHPNSSLLDLQACPTKTWSYR